MVFVAILMGADSDLPVMQRTADVLEGFGISYEMRITSAHRTPEDTRRYVADAESKGCDVFVAGAGMAAHLAGAVSAHTLKPVIGVPIDAGPLQGFDALLSNVQMPGGVPVAGVAIGKAGAKNAGYLSAQILGVSDKSLYRALVDEIQSNSDPIRQKNTALGW